MRCYVASWPIAYILRCLRLVRFSGPSGQSRCRPIFLLGLAHRDFKPIIQWRSVEPSPQPTACASRHRAR
jgi:hypothetical protein